MITLVTVKYKDIGYKKIVNELKKYKSLLIKAGIFSDAGENNGQRIVDYAVANEFGTVANGGYIPERSFIRSTADEKMSSWRESVNKYLTGVAEGKYTVRQALGFTGQLVVNDIVEKIGSNVRPENAPATKLKKAGSETANTTTLIDTGVMRKSVKYVIDIKE